MVELRLFGNRLTGTVPADLGRNSPLVCVDLSDNQLTGPIPPGICDRGELEELLMLDNRLTGGIPETLGRCRSLRRVRLSNNRLTGKVPGAVWGLPHVSLLELSAAERRDLPRHRRRGQPVQAHRLVGRCLSIHKQQLAAAASQRQQM